MTVVDDLKAARALIAKGWVQDAFFLDAKGAGPLYVGDECLMLPGFVPTCWCADGAIRWAICKNIDVVGVDDDRLSDAIKYLERAIDGGVWSWNDGPDQTQADVLAGFDRAIALAESDQRVAA